MAGDNGIPEPLFKNLYRKPPFPETTVSPLDAGFRRLMLDLTPWIHFVACRAIGMIF
jgi:hypothetical protein